MIYVIANAAVEYLREKAWYDMKPNAIHRAARYLEEYAAKNGVEECDLRDGKIKTGEWIRDGRKRRCSVCGKKVSAVQYYYCPHCGSYMKRKIEKEGEKECQTET